MDIVLNLFLKTHHIYRLLYHSVLMWEDSICSRWWIDPQMAIVQTVRTSEYKPLKSEKKFQIQRMSLTYNISPSFAVTGSYLLRKEGSVSLRECLLLRWPLSSGRVHIQKHFRQHKFVLKNLAKRYKVKLIMNG